MDENIKQGQAVRAAICFLIIVSGLAIVARLVIEWSTKWTISKKKLSDNVLGILALMTSIASGIALDLAIRNGFMSTSSRISPDSASLTQKSLYASEFFFVLTMGVSKSSVVMFWHYLFSALLYQHLTLLLNIGLGIWSVSCALVVLFQCQVPQPWAIVDGRCINLVAFWQYFGAMNIIIELAMFAVPTYALARLQMPKRKKSIVMACFATRVFDIAVAGTQLSYATRFGTMARLREDLWPWFLCGQILQAVTLITASIVYLRQFMEAFPSGMLQPDEMRRRGLSYADVRHGFITVDSGNKGSKGYVLRDITAAASKVTNRSKRTIRLSDTTTASVATFNLEAVQSRGSGGHAVESIVHRSGNDRNL